MEIETEDRDLDLNLIYLPAKVCCGQQEIKKEKRPATSWLEPLCAFFFVEIAGDGVLIDELEDEDGTAANTPLLYSRLPYITESCYTWARRFTYTLIRPRVNQPHRFPLLSFHIPHA
jgi:hypothetical protein